MASGVKILIAEDNPTLQSALRRALENRGYAVAQAFSAVELTHELSLATPDLLVLDGALPDADGRDLLATLKKDPKTRDIPVVIWSDRDPESDRRIALELGAEDFVEKGPPSALVPKIERILLRVSEEHRRGPGSA